MFDDRFFNPKGVKSVFGFLPELPPIPFSHEVLESHAGLGHDLVCYHDTAEGSPLTLADMASRAFRGGRNRECALGWYPLDRGQFDTDGAVLDDIYKPARDPLVVSGTPRAGWQLVSPGLLENSTGKHMPELTDFLIGYVRRQCEFGSGEGAIAFDKAVSEWADSGRKTVCDALYIEKKLSAAVMTLSSLSIVNMLFEPVQNTVYRFLLAYGAVSDERDVMRPIGYSRSCSPGSRGKFMSFGVTRCGGILEEHGACESWSCLGAVFSRMGY